MSILYVVATPIGNLDDITIRALKTLNAVAVIAAEDTRHTGKLLSHFQISTPQISYHDHNRRSRLPELLARLQAGESIALVSDAGMPGISDPGTELVQACITAGIPVVPIPGCSAVVTALSASGLATDRFVFEGFLPAKQHARQERLAALRQEERTLVLYESPHRLRQTLQDMAAIWGGDRHLVLARELTKLHEEFWRGTVEDAIAVYGDREPRGEYTLVVQGAMPKPQTPLPEAELRQSLFALMSQGMSRSQASRQLAQATALPRRQIYQLALTIPNNPD